MSYALKEVYYTIQGEGFHTGQPAIFCRFSGCNLWSGLEKDRDKAICQFCDTDFWGTDGVNGGKYTADQLVSLCKELWLGNDQRPFVVCTGGEPLLQLDHELIQAYKKAGFYLAIETNGTQDVPAGIDWVCMSPKEGTSLKIQKGNELKLVYPQGKMTPDQFEHLDFDHFFLQPMDNQNLQENIRACVDYCLKNPFWKLSIQTHKLIGMP